MKLTIDKKALDKSLRNIALEIHKQIQDNTAKGVDMNGSQFAKYSEPYIKYKAKYQRGKGSGSHVNLMLTGNMLRSISHKKSGEGYDIYFKEALMMARAYYHHFGKGQPKRAFFGVSQATEKSIFQKYMTQIARFV
jgi:hypothetical protein